MSRKEAVYISEKSSVLFKVDNELNKGGTNYSNSFKENS